MNKPEDRWEVRPEALGPLLGLAEPGFHTTAELEPLDHIVGQERAIQALQYGLSLRQTGYNVYVSGANGTGRRSLIRQLVEERARREKPPDDWVYVNNFDHPDAPLALRLPGGDGIKFRDDLDDLVERLRQDLPAVLKAKDFDNEKQKLELGYGERLEALFAQLLEKARELSLMVRRGPKGVLLFIPLKDGRPMQTSEIDELGTAERTDLERRQHELAEVADGLLTRQQDLTREMHEEVRGIIKAFARRLLEPMVQGVRERHPGTEVACWLDRVRDHLLNHLERLNPSREEPTDLPSALVAASEGDHLRDYRVNVVVDNSATRGAPVVFEASPNYRNLFGTVERDVNLFGRSTTDFTRIKAGSVLRANGGYLILDLADALTEPLVWKQLKRALRFACLSPDTYEPLALLAAGGLRPQPIPMDLKVVAVGGPQLFHLLRRFDEDFESLFRVHAELASDTARDAESERAYARFIARFGREEGVLPFEAAAVAEVIREGTRRAGDQGRLTLELAEIADLVREAGLRAAQTGTEVVRSEHVRQALEARVWRTGLVADRVRELIAEGTLRVAVTGHRVGEVNGLSVIDLGDIRFGRPSRVSASVGVGREGVINIERESDLSGSTHSKGVLILEGYLRERYAASHPLALSASLTFEQSYGWVEGDSASSAELYCLLSAVAQVPLRQDVAVTGSVDQHGRVQAVGGVNEKIEGFFDVCRLGGLTGSQGVCIPKANVRHLVLRPDVVEAVCAGQFHVWAVESVDEGIELLTGTAAGDIGQVGTFHWRLERRLVDFLHALESSTGEGRPRSRPHPSRIRRLVGNGSEPATPT